MKEATTIAHPQPPSSTLVEDSAMVPELLLPSGLCYSADRRRVPGGGHNNKHHSCGLAGKTISEVGEWSAFKHTYLKNPLM